MINIEQLLQNENDESLRNVYLLIELNKLLKIKFQNLEIQWLYYNKMKC